MENRYTNFIKKLFTLCVFITFSLLSHQNVIANNHLGIVITVVDNGTGFPIQGASVYNTEKIFSTITNSRGEANIYRLTLEDTIKVTYLGYQAYQAPLSTILLNGGVVRLETQPFLLEEYTVKGISKFAEHASNIPARLDVISSKSIALINPQTSADALLNTGNIFVQKSQMGGGSPVLRGFEANKVLLVVDGVRMNNAIYRNGHLQNAITIDNAILEQIEVVYGPSAVIYGSDALGGVMHFVTKRPKLAFNTRKNTLIEGNAYVRYATANLEKTVHLDLNIGKKKWASLTSVTLSDFQDLRSGANGRATYPEWGLRRTYVDQINGVDSVVQNVNPLVQVGTGYAQLDILEKILYQQTEDLSYTLNIQYSTSSNVPRYDQLADVRQRAVDGQLVDTYRFAEWDYGPQNRFLSSIRMDYTGQNNPYFNSMAVVAAYQNIEEDRISRRFRASTRLFQEEDVHVGSLNVDFIKEVGESLKTKETRLLYGVEVTYNRVNSIAFREDALTGERTFDEITRYPDGGSDMATAAVYLNYRQKINERLKVITGLRYTYAYLNATFEDTVAIQLPYQAIVLNSDAFTGSFGLNFYSGKDWHFDALVSTGFRIPNVDDFGKIRAVDDFVTVPNPNLGPERALNGELSIVKTILTNKQSWKVSLTGFYTHLFDAIVRENTTLNGSNQLFYDGEFYQTQWNTNAGMAYIYGGSLNVNAKFGDHWKFFSSVNYTKGWNSSDQRPLAHIPPLFGQASVSYVFDAFEIRLLGRYNGWKRAEDFSMDGTDNFEQATIDGTPSWYTINLYAAYTLGDNIMITLSGENLMDVHYRPFSSGVSAAGRNIIVSVRTKF